MLVSGAMGWRLPVVEADPGHPGDAEMIRRGVRERYGLDVTVLGCLAHEFDVTSRVGEWVREVESHSAGWTPRPPARWVGADELAAITLAQPRHGPLLGSWLAGGHRAAVAWERHGWWDGALAWSQAALRRRGFGNIEGVEQVRAWEFSMVLRLTAGTRRFFFKAVPADREREVHLTRRLAERHPGTVAEVLAFDAEQRWMLMASVDGPALEEIRDVRRWEVAARTYARLQIDWIERVGELHDLGCRDLRVPRLVAEIGPCLADISALSPGLRRDLKPLEIERLRTLAPVLADACAKLQAYAIPATLDHADLWASNVIDAPHGPAVIDWEDACLSHPFFGLWHLIVSAEDRVDDPVGAASRIRDAYLEAWTPYGSAEQLREAFGLAQRLAPLCYAIVFRLEVLPVLDASWELREFVPFFLRRLLAAWL